MVNKIVLSHEQIMESSVRISKDIFKMYKKILTKELDYIQTKLKSKDIDMSCIVNLMIASLAQIDSNVLIMTKNTFKGSTGFEIDFVKMMNLYLQDVLSIMNEDEQKRLKEKMN